MWADAFLSAALAIVCAVASPIVAVLGLPRGILFGLGVSAIACAALLAGFGAITAVLLGLRMRAGHHLLPRHLRLPLPRAMVPDLDAASARAET